MQVFIVKNDKKDADNFMKIVEEQLKRIWNRISNNQVF